MVGLKMKAYLAPRTRADALEQIHHYWNQFLCVSRLCWVEYTTLLNPPSHGLKPYLSGVGISEHLSHLFSTAVHHHEKQIIITSPIHSRTKVTNQTKQPKYHPLVQTHHFKRITEKSSPSPASITVYTFAFFFVPLDLHNPHSLDRGG